MDIETRFSLLDFDPKKHVVNGVSAYHDHKYNTQNAKASADAKLGKYYGEPCVYIHEGEKWNPYKYAQRAYKNWIFVKSLGIYRKDLPMNIVSLRNLKDTNATFNIKFTYRGERTKMVQALSYASALRKIENMLLTERDNGIISGVITSVEVDGILKEVLS